MGWNGGGVKTYKMKQSEKDKLYQEFKFEKMPIFRWMGIFQGILIVLMILGIILTIWINWRLILKIEATCLVTACIIGGIYNVLDKFTRKQFDEVLEDIN